MKARTAILRQLVLAVMDAGMVIAAFLLAYVVRFEIEVIPVHHGVPPFGWYLRPLGFVVFVYLVFFRSIGLYAIRRTWRPWQELGAIAHGATLASIVLMAVTFLYREASYSRVAVVMAWGLVIALAMAGRLALRRLVPLWRRRPRLLVIGAGPAAAHLMQRLQRQGTHELVGLVHPVAGADIADAAPVAGVHRLGTLRDVPQILSSRIVDEVVLAEHDLPRAQVMELIAQCEQELVSFHMVPDLLGMLTTYVGIQSLDGIPLLGLRETPLSEPWNRFAKRAMDLIIAAAGLIITALGWVVVAAAIKRDSPGPVFFLQERVGQDGQVFRIIKFRTMQVGAEDRTGPVWTTPDDQRRTRVGRLLRRWNLDELPQLLNVLKGEMSLVGPRPERPHFVRQFKQHIPRYMTRHRIRSGLTGWAQIHGLRGDTSIEERTQYDLYYLENWSLGLDCRILWRSLTALKNAY